MIRNERTINDCYAQWIDRGALFVDDCGMPRPRREDALQLKLDKIVGEAAAEIADAVRANIATEVARLLGASSSRTVASRMVRKRSQILCPICGDRAGGPRWNWACARHKDLPIAQLKKARQESKK
jgi:hypothetical protein